MTRPCPVCGEPELPKHSRFCLACGAPVRVETDASYTPPHLEREVLTTRTAQDGERKEVTILFADVTGSLAMAEALDPEEIHAIMQGLFGIALDAVHAQRGTINQFRGDGFMALFGAPRTRGEDAARALRAALTIREGAGVYGRELEARSGIPLLLRMGLNTGTVWVGSVGSDLRRDYTAEGPTVGLAARLEEAAEPGQILLSGETARRAQGLFEYRELGTRQFRGLSRQVDVLELVGPGRYRDRFEIERAHGLTPFVGRRAELEWLARVSSECGSELIQIRGEPGIGKSRLAHEFLAGRAGSVLHAPGREDAAARAYVPWLELLRRWPEALPGAAGAASLERAYGGALEPASGSPDDFASRLLDLLVEAAHDGPLLVLLEDTQWMDASSTEVLERISGSGAPVTLIATARGEAEPDAPLTLELAPLARGHARALAESVLARVEDPLPLSEVAISRGGGNPLFVEEVARALRDGGPGLRESARIEAEWRRRHEPVPETLAGVVAARIDALPDPAKRLLQAASVIGRPFDPELLARIDSEPGTRAGPLAVELVARALLRPLGDGRLEFHHGIVRDVGYAQLLGERRRQLHLRCAEEFERRSSASTPEGASFVGTHFERAGLPERALEPLERAGKAYLRLGAMTEAAEHLRRAWALRRGNDGDLSALVSTGVALASALNALDRSADAADVLSVLRDVPVDPNERRRIAAICIEGGWVRASEDGEVDAGRELIEHGLDLIGDDPQSRRLAMGAHAHLVRLHTMDGDTRRAVAASESLLALAGPDDAFFTAFALGSKGSALADRGDAKEALAACEQAVLCARGNEVASAMAHALLAQAQVYAERPHDALASADTAIESGRRSEQRGAVYNAITWRGEARLLLDEPEAAMREFEELERIHSGWAGTPLRLARGALACGRLNAAERFARRCLELGRGRVIRARALCALGRALGVRDGEAAERALLESIAILEPLGLRPHLAEACAALGHWYASRGRDERAIELTRRARDLYRACGAGRGIGLQASSRPGSA